MYAEKNIRTPFSGNGVALWVPGTVMADNALVFLGFRDLSNDESRVRRPPEGVTRRITRDKPGGDPA
jgi:hypothetical protein